MKRILSLLAALVTIALPAIALEVPPAPTQWVTDRAGILDAGSADALNAKLRAFEERTGTQFIIYTLPSLEGDSLERFTIAAAEAWRVGQKKYDNGLILFVFPQDRKVRIEVGYGLEGTVTDALSSRVIRQDIAPAFQAGNYAGGLGAAADRLIALVEKGEEPHPVQRAPGRGGEVQVPFWVILLIPIFIIFVLGPLSSRAGCMGPACWLPFLMGGGTTFGGHHRGGVGRRRVRRLLRRRWRVRRLLRRRWRIRRRGSVGELVGRGLLRIADRGLRIADCRLISAARVNKFSTTTTNQQRATINDQRSTINDQRSTINANPQSAIQDPR